MLELVALLHETRGSGRWEMQYHHNVEVGRNRRFVINRISSGHEWCLQRKLSGRVLVQQIDRPRKIANVPALLHDHLYSPAVNGSTAFTFDTSYTSHKRIRRGTLPQERRAKKRPSVGTPHVLPSTSRTVRMCREQSTWNLSKTLFATAKGANPSLSQCLKRGACLLRTNK